jgi:hypothetical protein
MPNDYDDTALDAIEERMLNRQSRRSMRWLYARPRHAWRLKDYEHRVLERALVRLWMKSLRFRLPSILSKHRFVEERGKKQLEIEYEDLSKRDAMVAVTMLMWLGTNVGLSELNKALSEVGWEITLRKRKRDSDAW